MGPWLVIAIEITGLFIALAGGLWAYSKFVVERGLLPPVEFKIDFNVVGSQKGKRLVEISLHLKNLGVSTLVATDVRASLRYLNSDDSIDVFANTEEKTFARIIFPHSLRKDILGKKAKSSWINIVDHDIIVGPGVDQVCTLVTAVPDSAIFVLVKGKFKYLRKPSILQRIVINLSHLLGLTQFTLKNVTKPHSVEHAFRLSPVENEDTT